MDGVLTGLNWLGTSTYWLAFLGSISMATLAALVPGISASLLMALAIPFIVFNIQEPVIGIVMLATIAAVDDMLDVVPIVVLGHPGGGQVTFIEARPLASRGKAARVLGFIYAVSAIGGLVGALVLLAVIPIIKPFILKFSFSEIAALGLFGVAIVGALSRGAMVKGIAMGALGLLLSTVGLSPFTGEARFTFDVFHLYEGLPLIATIIGLFALPEMIDLLMARKSLAPANAKISTREVFKGAGLALRCWRLIIRHSLFGVFLGAIPGVGARVVSWLSYGVGISLTKNRARFGKGSYRGLIFSESVQSSKEGGQAIPTLALGVPGGQAWVFVLVAMVVYGISPGPSLLSDHGDIITLIVISLILGNVALCAVGMVWSSQLAKLANIPYPMIAAVVIPLAILSAFQETRQWIALPILFGFALLGFVMKYYRWPRPPLILGFVLGGIIEENLMTSISVYGLVGTFQRPMTIALIVLAIVIAVFFTRLANAEARSTSSAAEALRLASGEPRPPWTWNTDSTFALILIAFSVFIVWQSFDYRPAGRWFPLTLATVMLALSVTQIVKSGWERGPSNVLDLAMLSTGEVGSRYAGFMVLASLAGYVVLTLIIGMQYAAIVLAAAMPAIFMFGKQGAWRWGILTGGILCLLVFGLFDELLNIVWPEPWLARFFQ